MYKNIMSNISKTGRRGDREQHDNGTFYKPSHICGGM